MIMENNIDELKKEEIVQEQEEQEEQKEVQEKGRYFRRIIN